MQLFDQGLFILGERLRWLVDMDSSAKRDVGTTSALLATLQSTVRRVTWYVMMYSYLEQDKGGRDDTGLRL